VPVDEQRLQNVGEEEPDLPLETDDLVIPEGPEDAHEHPTAYASGPARCALKALDAVERAFLTS
jgi:hypothetical protein